ncbi:CAP domain-containing protein [Patescibacteria group bacterium]
MRRILNYTFLFIAKIIKTGLIVGIFLAIFVLGYFDGYLDPSVRELPSGEVEVQDVAEVVMWPFSPPITPTPVVVPTDILVKGDGPQLWEYVNRRRVELGSGDLELDEQLCTIASLRLNELIRDGELDAHEGFNTLRQRRPDLEPILDSYPNMSEFLAQGGETPQETLELWEGTLGHRAVVTNPEYEFGCIYSQNTFAVAITAY